MVEQLKIYIAGLGAITAVGGNVPMTCAAVNARINRYKDTGYINHKKHPVKMALVPPEALADLPAPDKAYSRWEQQLQQLLLGALTETLSDFETKSPIPLVLSCPESHLLCPHQLPDDFLENLIAISGASINPELSRIVQTGRSGLLDALEIAYKLFLNTNVESVLLGGVDSYQKTDRLNQLIAEERINTADAYDGFTPGEGAGFVLLTRNKAKAMQGDTCLVSVAAPGLAQESGHLYSELPYLGEGMASAIKQSLTNFNGANIQRIYSSMNGERFWIKELSVGLMRNQKHLNKKYQIEHPADCYGDLGAASGAVLIALAAQHLFKQNKAMSHLVCCASDYGFRSAVTLCMESKQTSFAQASAHQQNGNQQKQNEQQVNT